MKVILFSLFVVLTVQSSFAQVRQLSLAGRWSYRLDSLDRGMAEKWENQTFTNAVNLPGTLDGNSIGTPVKADSSLTKQVMLHLSRKKTYIGAAWYQRVINTSANMQNAVVSLERVLWRSNLWLDGKPIGSQESLIAPHIFSLGELKAGKHTLTIRVDNRKQHDISVNDFAHAYTDGTQIIWNGMIGKMELMNVGGSSIKTLQAFPSLAGHTVKAIIALQQKPVNKTYARLTIYNGKKVIGTIRPAAISKQETEVVIKTPDAKPWDEFHPQVYQLRAELLNDKGELLDVKNTTLGFRDITAKGNQLKINGRPLFLRGTLECNIFPLEGHPPMTAPGWEKVFETARAYGLNHLRFHSWCPPEAAFKIADSLGFYLHVELPLWVLTVGKDLGTITYLEAEAANIIQQYGNHPSFCFWSMGNELEGDFDWLENLVRKLKKEDSRHLYTTTTFTFQKGHGTKPEPADDYFITQYTEKGWVRGQGIFNTQPPDFKTDYSKALAETTVPLIIHEVGQYSVYPDLAEIEKYTGVLRPDNFKAIRNDLRKKQMLPLAPQYLKASGALTVQLYKEEIERALKTRGVGGFQLLDLHDFPGQGTALVGILNAFWDSKGLITPGKFREFCGPVVPLLRFEKAAYRSNETFNASVEVANYGGKIIREPINWTVTSEDKLVQFKGTLGEKTVPIGNGSSTGSFSVNLGGIDKATALTVAVSIGNTPYRNEWKIWVYPQSLPAYNQAVFTGSVDSAIQMLNAGKRVIFSPDVAAINGIEGRFATVFWSPVHFPDQPGSMGLLIDEQSKALANFPTNNHSHWQWWDLVTRSKSLQLDRLPFKTKPVVRVIDNFFKNRELATIVEFKMGAGKLLICTMDISKQLSERAAASQLRYSLSTYVSGNNFAPVYEISAEELRQLIR
ncbi:sugar-binding domain-containing protein [Mucilaginibacter terrae]|uniref:Glycoside hydrolase family 2 n=1 Tax=Mucilaginibacter terrae TaxID=1955052 RepID=A0ABU3GWQ3_9SPHI|nr:sugar-binding domain-containing protein [Mucilaginibacter terrae]MDT3403100.1 hypothetical protein [Mucilaginibacter terrae]